MFFKLVKRLKPANVIFIGVEAANTLQKYDPTIKVIKETPVGRTSPSSCRYPSTWNGAADQTIFYTAHEPIF